MKAAELIKRLQDMPADAEVGAIWDGAMRSMVQCVWLARRGVIALSDYDHPVYWDDDRPADAPTREEETYWRTPENPNPGDHA